MINLNLLKIISLSINLLAYQISIVFYKFLILLENIDCTTKFSNNFIYSICYINRKSQRNFQIKFPFNFYQRYYSRCKYILLQNFIFLGLVYAFLAFKQI